MVCGLSPATCMPRALARNTQWCLASRWVQQRGFISAMLICPHCLALSFFTSQPKSSLIYRWSPFGLWLPTPFWPLSYPWRYLEYSSSFSFRCQYTSNSEYVVTLLSRTHHHKNLCLSYIIEGCLLHVPRRRMYLCCNVYLGLSLGLSSQKTSIVHRVYTLARVKSKTGSLGRKMQAEETAQT